MLNYIYHNPTESNLFLVRQNYTFAPLLEGIVTTRIGDGPALPPSTSELDCLLSLAYAVFKLVET